MTEPRLAANVWTMRRLSDAWRLAIGVAALATVLPLTGLAMLAAFLYAFVGFLEGDCGLGVAQTTAKEIEGGLSAGADRDAVTAFVDQIGWTVPELVDGGTLVASKETVCGLGLTTVFATFEFDADGGLRRCMTEGGYERDGRRTTIDVHLH